MKTALVLFNLGGPASLDEVKPFLYNLFSDPAIISLHTPLRQFVAGLISSRREHTAKEIYAQMGGCSPILPETEAQRSALEQALSAYGDYRVFICMRYSAPRAIDVAKEVVAYAPDNVILLPLYPQFSTTTTESSFREWSKVSKSAGIQARTTQICCYYEHYSFIKAYIVLLDAAIEQALQRHNLEDIQIIFSAHGLPEKVVKAGDPYKMQVERGAAAIATGLKNRGAEWVVAYQSRVGPLQWTKPYTDEVIKQAAFQRRVVIVLPIAFVSEHSETLVELDIEYRKLALENGARDYIRVQALRSLPMFIDGLRDLTLAASKSPAATYTPGPVCPAICGKCACR